MKKEYEGWEDEILSFEDAEDRVLFMTSYGGPVVKQLNGFVVYAEEPHDWDEDEMKSKWWLELDMSIEEEERLKDWLVARSKKRAELAEGMKAWKEYQDKRRSTK